MNDYDGPSRPRRPFSGRIDPPTPEQMQFHEGGRTDTYREATVTEQALWLAGQLCAVEFEGRLWVRTT